MCRSADANTCVSWATTASQRALGEVIVCAECGLRCRNRQVLGAHRSQKHGIRRLTRQYVDGTHCPACLLEFHSRDRLIQHLERASLECREFVLTERPELSEDTVRILDEEAAAHVRKLAHTGKHRVHALLPCVRLRGPLLRIPAMQLEARRSRKKV